MAGKDASKQFWKYHNESILKKYQKKLMVGSLDTKAAPPAPPASEKKDIVKPEANPGVVAPQPTSAAAEESEPFDSYGDLVPYADPSWYQTVGGMPGSDTKARLTTLKVPFSLLQRDPRYVSRRDPRMGRREDRTVRYGVGGIKKGPRRDLS